jgi:hypothetical protein
MARFWLVVIVLLLLVLAGGAIYLMVADIPAPTQNVEKVLPGEMFPE